MGGTENATGKNGQGTTTEMWVKRKENAVLLASQYTPAKRAMEYICVSLFAIFWTMSLYNVYINMSEHQSFWFMLSACILAMIVADVFSGLVHWGVDTWGTLDTPVVGKTFIRSFREHHVDPFRITVHDFIEANGDNCMITVPALAILSFLPIRKDNIGDLFIVSFMAFLATWISFTNQIHKWAHTRKPPMLVNVLQQANVILSRKNHQIHHHNPFDRYYCITTGWLNPILGSIAFWKRVENFIIWASSESFVPRNDDAFWTLQQDSYLSSDKE